MAKIGIFGGSFNPPHNGHINSVKTAINELDLDKVLLIPAKIPPHKQMPEGTPAQEHRYKMLELTAKTIEKTEVSDLEFKRDGTSYTWDTVCELKERYPKDELYLLVGTDMFLSLPQWYYADELLQTVNVVAFHRDDQKMLAMAETLRKDYGTTVHLLENDIIEISSTQLRDKIADGSAARYLPQSVYVYIVENELYGVEPTEIDKMRVEVCKILSGKRLTHVLGTEGESRRLARHWGADEHAAAAAAILHDITKELDRPAQLKLCEKYGIILDDIEMKQRKLLHAKTGAEKAKELFHISDEIYHAIYWHTTGRANMTLLDKIIYLADYIEPNRAFPGVEEIRSLAYKNLDGAVLLGLVMTKKEIEESGESLHFRSNEAIEWIVRNKNENLWKFEKENF